MRPVSEQSNVMKACKRMKHDVKRRNYKIALVNGSQSQQAKKLSKIRWKKYEAEIKSMPFCDK